MSFSAAGVAYLGVGGLLLYSGIKGATIADTVHAVFAGNLKVANTETIAVNNTTTATSAPAATGTTPSEQQIIGNAMKYNGHKYVWGGPSNPTDGWDCSSFASYSMGHDLGMLLPGNKTWAAATSNGADHGPVASDFANMPGFYKVNDNAAQNQPGDLLVWTGHVGFGTGSGGMFSALDQSLGTGASSASAPYPYLGTYRLSTVSGGGGGGKVLAN